MISIVIPAYNEQDSISLTIDDVNRVLRARGISYEIIVVDDGSSDNTAVFAQQKQVKVIKHQANLGYGASLKDGINSAAGDIVAIIDADGTYKAEDLWKIIDGFKDVDMVVGARSMSSVNISAMRKPAKWLINRLADYLAETKIDDLNSGLRVFKKDIAKKFYSILPNGFSFTTTITLSMLTNGYSVKFVPIDYLARSGGKSKIKPINDTINFIILIIRTVLYFNPLKIFVPMSLILFSLGFFVLVFSTWFLGRLMDVTVTLFFLSGLQTLVIGMLADLIDKRIGINPR